MRNRRHLTAYYFVLEKHLEPEIDLFSRRCGRRNCFVYKDDPGTVTVAFSEADDAMLFMNLYDGEIRDEYKVVGDESTVDQHRRQVAA